MGSVSSTEPEDCMIGKSTFDAVNSYAEEKEEISRTGLLAVIEKCETCTKTVQTYFPGSMEGSALLKRLKNAMLAEGMTAENTLYAQSVCPDEINHKRGDITQLLYKELGEVFHLGGLGGIPFTGKTGFGAFSHHIPDDGHIFILFAPHVGISETLQVGKYTREGQSCREGAACGAAIGAFNHCVAGNNVPAIDTHDYQMKYIIGEVHKWWEEIEAHKMPNDKMVALTHMMFKLCKEYLDTIVPAAVTDMTGKSGVKICILGGIQINTPQPLPDYFLPLTFEMREESETVDLLHHLKDHA